MTKKNFRKSYKGGFTLIELLVVVAIIGILASVVFASLNSARAKARNAKRISDIRQLVTAFNLGLTETNSLPSSSGWKCVSAACWGDWVGTAESPTVDAYLAPYISPKLSDPSDPTRNVGGYLFNDNWAGATSPWTGNVFGPGAYLDFFVEGPLTSTSCGAGKTWSVSSRIECYVKID